MSAGTVADGVRLAWGTLTAIPGPPPRRVDRGVARVAMLVGWAVVLPMTLAAALVGWAGTRAGLPDLACGLLTVGTLQLLSKGIHADGLADTADGLGSGRTPERSLEIMRTGDVGPLGATALVLVLGLEASLAGDLLQGSAGWLVVALALALGRLGLLVGASRALPSARPQGLGATVAGTVPHAGFVASLAVAVLVAASAHAAVTGWGPDPSTAAPWLAWPVAALCGLVLAAALAVLALRRVGGVTGDVLGALVEVTTVGVLVALAALL